MSDRPGGPPSFVPPASVGIGPGGPSLGLFLATLQDLVRATNRSANNIAGQAGAAAGGDLGGTYPDPIIVVAGLPWTPVLAFGGASVGITYGIQSGLVIELGKLAVAHFKIILTSKGSSVGAATIAGLTSTCGAIDGAVVISSHAAMATSNVFECSLPAGTALIQLGKGNAVASAPLANTDFNNTTAISGTVTYIRA